MTLNHKVEVRFLLGLLNQVVGGSIPPRRALCFDLR